MAYQRRIGLESRGKAAGRSWWFDIQRRTGSPFRVRIEETPAYMQFPAEYTWIVDCPRCGLGEGTGTVASAARAETAAKQWAQEHDRR